MKRICFTVLLSLLWLSAAIAQTTMIANQPMPTPPPVTGAVPKRGVLNINFMPNDPTQLFINLIMQSGATTAPSSGSQYNTGIIFGPAMLDGAGYPKCTNVVGSTTIPQCGSTVTNKNNYFVPASAKYGGIGSSGYYCLQGIGNAKITMNLVGLQAVAKGSGKTCGARAPTSGINWSQDDCSTDLGNTSITSATITVNDSVSGSKGWCFLFQTNVPTWSSAEAITWNTIDPGGPNTNCGPSRTEACYLHSLALYQGIDAPRWGAGKYFRLNALEELVANDPGVLRFMNWNWGIGANDMRFEYRETPFNVVGFGGSAPGFTNLVPYTVGAEFGGAPTADPPGCNSMGPSGINQYCVPASAMAGFPQTPASMQHGENVALRFDTASIQPSVFGVGQSFIGEISVPTAGTVAIETIDPVNLQALTALPTQTGGVATVQLNTYGVSSATCASSIVTLAMATTTQFQLAQQIEVAATGTGTSSINGVYQPSSLYDHVAGTSAAPITGTYDPVTANVTLTSPKSLGLVAGSSVVVSAAAGTNSFASINGTWTLTAVSADGKTLTFNIGTTGLTMTITNSTITDAVGTSVQYTGTSACPGTLTVTGGNAFLSAGTAQNNGKPFYTIIAVASASTGGTPHPITAVSCVQTANNASDQTATLTLTFAAPPSTFAVGKNVDISGMGGTGAFNANGVPVQSVNLGTNQITVSEGGSSQCGSPFTATGGTVYGSYDGPVLATINPADHTQFTYSVPSDTQATATVPSTKSITWQNLSPTAFQDQQVIAIDQLNSPYVYNAGVTTLQSYYTWPDAGYGVITLGCGTGTAYDQSCLSFPHNTTGLPSVVCNTGNTCGISNCTTFGCARMYSGASLQVGQGNDRRHYPMLNWGGGLNFTNNNSLTVGEYHSLCFNKNLIGFTDNNGNPVYGAWTDCGIIGGGSVVNYGAPLEMQAELIAEVNALNPVYPIGLYYNMPLYAMICDSAYSDPDCAPGSDWPANAVNVLLNGANGIPGINTSCPSCTLVVEDNNETWNNNGSDGPGLQVLGQQLGGNPPHWGCSIAPVHADSDTMADIHAQLVAQDIKLAGLHQSNVVLTLGGDGTWGTIGGGVNFVKMAGGGLLRDTNQLNGASCYPALITGPGNTNPPIQYFDAFNIATYVGFGAWGQKYLGQLSATPPTGGATFDSFGGAVITGIGGGYTGSTVYIGESITGAGITSPCTIASIGSNNNYTVTGAGCPTTPVTTPQAINLGFTCHAPSSGSQGPVGCANQWVYDAETFGLTSTQAQNDTAAGVVGMNYSGEVGSNCNLSGAGQIASSIYCYEAVFDPCLGELLGTGNFLDPVFTKTFCGEGAATPLPLRDTGGNIITNKILINYEGGTGYHQTAPYAIKSATCTGGVVTANTGLNASLSAQQDAYIFGSNPSGYDGVYKVGGAWNGQPDPINGVSGTTFNYTLLGACPLALVWGGQVTSAVASAAQAPGGKGNISFGGYAWAVEQSQAWSDGVNYGWNGIGGNVTAGLQSDGQPGFFQSYVNGGVTGKASGQFIAPQFAQYLGLPSVFTFNQCGIWTMSCPDNYGLSGGVPTEGAGYFPEFYGIGNKNRLQN